MQAAREGERVTDVLVERTELPVMVVLRIVAEALPWIWMPPAVASCSTPVGTAEDVSAVLLLTRLSVITGLPACRDAAAEGEAAVGQVTSTWLSVTTGLQRDCRCG